MNLGAYQISNLGAAQK